MRHNGRKMRLVHMLKNPFQKQFESLTKFIGGQHYVTNSKNNLA